MPLGTGGKAVRKKNTGAALRTNGKKQQTTIENNLGVKSGKKRWS